MIKLGQEAPRCKEWPFCVFWKGRNILRHPVSGQKQKQSIRSPHTFFCLSPSSFLPPPISSFHTSCFLTIILSLFAFFPYKLILSLSHVVLVTPLCAGLCERVMDPDGGTLKTEASYLWIRLWSQGIAAFWKWHNTLVRSRLSHNHSFIIIPAISYSE